MESVYASLKPTEKLSGNIPSDSGLGFDMESKSIFSELTEVSLYNIIHVASGSYVVLPVIFVMSILIIIRCIYRCIHACMYA